MKVSLKKILVKNCVDYAKNICKGIFQTRDLVTMPPNILNPKQFANEIIAINENPNNLCKRLFINANHLRDGTPLQAPKER